MGIGVFGLKSVYKKQLENINDRKDTQIPEVITYGYFFAGAINGLSSSEIFRLDFSTEVTTTPGTFALNPSYGFSSVSNSSYGYISNGISACRVTRLDFSTETVTAPTSNLTVYRFGGGAVSNPAYGWFAGGWNPAVPAYYCTIDRLDFSTETIAAPGKSPGQLVSNRSYLGSVSASSFGYFGGGYTTGLVRICTLERLDFSAETTSTPAISPGQLTSARSGVASISSLFYGYFAGGSTPTTGVNTIDRIDFTTETTTAPGKNLISNRDRFSGVSNITYGYFAGGGTGLTPLTYYCTIERLELANETISTTSGPLPKTQTQQAGIVEEPGLRIVKSNYFSTFSESSLYGYFGGGQTGTPTFVNTIDRIDFSTETTTAPGKNLTTPRRGLATVSSSSYGYFGGGYFSPILRIYNTIDRIDFSTETISLPGKNLIIAKEELASVLNTSYGYFGGGINPPIIYNLIDRIDFSTETISAPGNNLTQARYYFSGTSSSSYGYFGGGFDASVNSKLDRIDFSTETTSASRNNLSVAKYGGSATSNNFYGYFMGGAIPSLPFSTSDIDRLDFSTENISILPNRMPIGYNQSVAVSNIYYGYIAGRNGAPSNTTIDRLDFSTELTSAKSFLTQGRSLMGAVSGGQATRNLSSAIGYYIGGYNNLAPARSTINRLDITTESVSTLSTTLVNFRRYLSSGLCSSRNYGYTVGGLDTVPVSGIMYCTINRIDYSNDVNSDLSNTLPLGGERIAVSSSANYGYIGGGQVPTPGVPSRCTITRLDFSNEILSLPGKNFTSGIGLFTATTSASYGYFGGGFGLCTINRLDFTTEVLSASPGSLTTPRRDLGSLSNYRYGYFCGGTDAPQVTHYCTIDRLDFSTDTTTLLGSSFSTVRQNGCGISENFYGYFGGGNTNAPAFLTFISRLDFSNETIISNRLNLPTATTEASAATNSYSVSTAGKGFFR